MTTTRRVTWPQANARRMARQHLTDPAPAGDASPAAVTGAMLGAHAQVPSAAELSVALRLEGATRATVREALWTDGTLVKTYGPRGTVHLLPSADLPLWTGALSSIPAGADPMPPHVRMTREQTEAVLTAIGEALADRDLTADELTEAVVERAGPWAGDRVMDAFQDKWPRWRQVSHRAAHRGVLCFGPLRGRRVTYTHPRRVLPGFTPRDGAAAQAELVRRYLRAYGPATPQHFARWLAAPRGWAGEVFAAAAARGEAEEVRYEGAPAWVVAGDTEFPAGPAAGVRLLPYFDAFAIASQPRDLLFPGPSFTRALGGGQAGNHPVLLVDGTVAGVWHQRRSGRRIAVTVEPVAEDVLSPRRLRALQEQVERIGEVLEGRAELTVGKVTVGPHA
ncbi:winged helix DNA-binding domain-containing protein [Streptomyces sp. NPDC059544]|uniref:winged helix DNA-binding domain-containing protein n=1 Tax=Streptomyces sp. NPDC059544 TaxID=3346861 RepID=UPI003687DBDC